MEPVEEYQVILTTQARQLFAQIKDTRQQRLLLSRIEKLKHDPVTKRLLANLMQESESNEE
ncbi:MAG: hypothetical protein F6K47_39440 [Symploca sp. SIO2E6]|nr:hypothetical protein [Symploca sp. SIO2E6]